MSESAVAKRGGRPVKVEVKDGGCRTFSVRVPLECREALVRIATERGVSLGEAVALLVGGEVSK